MSVTKGGDAEKIKFVSLKYQDSTKENFSSFSMLRSPCLYLVPQEFVTHVYLKNDFLHTFQYIILRGNSHTARGKIWKEPLRDTKILFCGRVFFSSLRGTNSNATHYLLSNIFRNATCFAPDQVRTAELVTNFIFRVRLHLQWIKERQKFFVCVDLFHYARCCLALIAS